MNGVVMNGVVMNGVVKMGRRSVKWLLVGIGAVGIAACTDRHVSSPSNPALQPETATEAFDAAMSMSADIIELLSGGEPLQEFAPNLWRCRGSEQVAYEYAMYADDIDRDLVRDRVAELDGRASSSGLEFAARPLETEFDRSGSVTFSWRERERPLEADSHLIIEVSPVGGFVRVALGCVDVDAALIERYAHLPSSASWVPQARP